MSERVTVREMVREWLDSHGYEGLWTDFGGGEACGCGLDDLAPCGGRDVGLPEDCVAAYRGIDGLFYPVEGEAQ